MCYTQSKIAGGGEVHCGSLMIQTFWNPTANLETSMSMVCTVTDIFAVSKLLSDGTTILTMLDILCWKQGASNLNEKIN